MKYFLVFIVATLAFTSCSTQVDAFRLEGCYVARYPFGADSLQLMNGGEYHQWISVTGDSIVQRTSGSWKFDSTSNYIKFENRMLIVDGFGKLRKDYAQPQVGVSLLPVWRKFFFGGIRLGTDELTPYRRID